MLGYFVGIALSAIGNRVAIVGNLPGTSSSHVRLLDWKGSEWVQVGPDLIGSRRFGHGVALSSDGNRVAIGKSSPENKDYGHVRIYDGQEVSGLRWDPTCGRSSRRLVWLGYRHVF